MLHRRPKPRVGLISQPNSQLPVPVSASASASASANWSTPNYQPNSQHPAAEYSQPPTRSCQLPSSCSKAPSLLHKPRGASSMSVGSVAMSPSPADCRVVSRSCAALCRTAPHCTALRRTAPHRTRTRTCSRAAQRLQQRARRPTRGRRRGRGML
jgi:hypothetical protein